MKREPEPEELEIEIVSIGDEAEVAADGGGDAAESPVAAADVEELREKLAAAEERTLRLRAEFDNFRKRLEREREDRERRALARPFLDLLPVVDNLERAANAPGGADDLRRGVDLIARQIVELLRGYGLAEIPAVGKPFDPRLHEAVSRVESREHQVPTVIAELQRGYWLNDKLLRPAMVEVAMPVEGE
ncbi:MAG: nucleotide exchange factor GrpE, partial [Myxococcota bacterium]